MTRRDEFSAACTLTHLGRPDVTIMNGSPFTKPMIVISAMVKDLEAILVIAFCMFFCVCFTLVVVWPGCWSAPSFCFTVREQP